MSDLTPWFSYKTKPVHIGVYKVDFGYAFWNGRKWGWASITAQGATEDKTPQGADQNKNWRGLSARPESAQ